MDPIFIRVRWPQATEQVAEWECECRFPGADGAASVLPLADALRQAADAVNDAMGVTVLLPAELVLYERVQLPARGQRQALQALPFVVEEWLAEDIEQVHMAVGQRTADGHWPVLVVDLRFIADLFDLAAQASVLLEGVYVDAQALPGATGELAIRMLDDRVLVSSADKLAAFALQEASDLIHLMLGETTFASVQIHHQAGHEQQALLAQQLATEYSALGDTRVAVKTLDDAQGWEPWSSGLSPAAINLLQGRFTVRRQGGSLPWWQVAAAVALFAWVGQVGLQASTGWVFHRGADALERQAEDHYRQLFPEAQQVSEPRRRIESKLLSGGGSGDITFAWLFGSAVEALQAVPDRDGLSIEQLRFESRNGELQLELKARSIDQLDQYKQSLGKLGLSGRISSANEADGAVSGRMQITRGG